MEEPLRKKNMSFRIAGHESFPCRYAWLPKAVQGLSRDSKLFSDDDRAIVDLGVGKNMVRSIRFWSQVTGMTKQAAKGAGHLLTDEGRILLGDHGLDPFLEDVRTLWLIHWNLSTDVENPLLAWDFLLNRWQEPEFVRSKVITALEQEVVRRQDGFSRVTLEQHFDTFLHTYIPTRGRKGEVQEDNLDCPLVELELIVKVGEREIDRSAGKREPIYTFRREEKPEVTPELFAYCLYDFWQRRHLREGTLALREIAHGHGSPGQIFKIPEEDLRSRLEALARRTGGLFTYMESANIPHVRKSGERDRKRLLRDIYAAEAAHV
jgi:Protein of unknown function (DUF4007)